jgi:hypothetical protein
VADGPAKIIARVANGPYTLLVAADDYEHALELAQDWVFLETGQRYTPTYYTDLTSLAFRGVVGTIDEENGAGTDG